MKARTTLYLGEPLARKINRIAKLYRKSCSRIVRDILAAAFKIEDGIEDYQIGGQPTPAGLIQQAKKRQEEREIARILKGLR
jgi:hypothetical protein